MPRIALVLSGGGARGAYEAGVLSYVFDEIAARMTRPVHFDIITGTSVGAVHACYVAASQQEGAAAAAKLLAVWRSLSLDRVFAMGPTDLLRVPWQLFAGVAPRVALPAHDGVPERLPGLFETGWLEEIVLEQIPWRALRLNIDSGQIEALAVTATEIATGRSVVFVDSASKTLSPWGDPYVVARPVRVTPGHALASAAIPLVFPALRLGKTYYCDGGLRLNTPLAPALRLGAEKVMVIGLRYPRPVAEEDRIAQGRELAFATPAYLVGKALNALLLDRVEYDVERLRFFNQVLEAGQRLYGEDFSLRINEAIGTRRDEPFHIVRDLMVRPSRDLGSIAADCLRHQKRGRGLRDWLSHQMVRYAGHGTLGEADLLSYLFFDRCYADHLIELGRHDAKVAEDRIVEFLS
jgi:NTE family protein